jgi:uncharacterized membrane protein
MANKTLFAQLLEQSQSSANQNVMGAFQQIQQSLISSINLLRSAGQSVPLNIDEIVDGLNQARDEWLNHLRGTFDTQIAQLKATLQQYYIKP